MLTIVKKNDSYDAITYQLENEDNSTVDLTGASVNFVMGKKNKLITNAKATVTSATSGIVSYQLTPLDTLVSGTFLAEFVVTFANGTTKTYPSNGYITVDVEQNLDTSQANVVVDMIAEKQGDFTSKLNSILLQAGNINMSAMNEYSWTATEGQLIFIFPSSVNYTPSTKWFQVSVGNVPVDNTLVNRSYDNQFALNIDSSNIKSGMTVRAMWVEPITPVVPNSYKIIPQQDLPPVDAGEGDLWFDTSDNSYQGTVFDTLNTQLAEITSRVYHVKDFNVIGDGTDETTKLKAAIENLPIGSKLMFDGSKTYKINGSINIKNSFIELDGRGCTIQSITTSATTLFQTFTNNYKTVNNANVSIGQRVSAITLPDVTGINVGDIYLIYNSTAVGGYNTGIMGEILRIDATNKIIYVSNTSDTAFTADRISFYTSYLNVKIHGFNINCTQYDIGIWLQYAKNSKVYNNVITSNGGRVGVNNSYSINCNVEDNYIYGFRDDLNVDNKSGYGIHLGGHNNIALHNIIKDCKHAITAGEGLHKCSHMKFRDNTVYAGTATTLALLDFHNNCAGEIVNNYVYTFNNQAGIVTRCSNATIKDNKIINDKNSTAYFKAINIGSSATESPSLDNIQIIGNEAYGKVDELIEFTTGIAFSNIKIKDNISENGYINIIGTLTGALIEKNKLKNNAQIIIPANAKDVIISKNVVVGGNTEYDNLIAINTGCANMKITENILTHQTGGGGSCIRTASPYTQIVHNTLICSASNQFTDVNAYNNHIIKDNVVYSLDYTTVTNWTV